MPHVVLGVVLASGCTADDGQTGDDGPSPDTQCRIDDPTTYDDLDESACAPASTDYQPGSDDMWPACVTDDRAYHLIASTPSSIARVEAFEQVMDALVSVSPTADDFTAARTIYAQEEGLESRLVRREDMHYPAIPESDWMEGVDPDKQCTVEANVAAYPERCAGPARIAPLLNEAFVAGQQGDGLAAVHKGRIEGALLWFLHLSVYKEANTCLLKAKDCDSSWAYYTGGSDRDGGIGLAAYVREQSDWAHQRIWDGFSAYRCWRELYDIDTYPTPEDTDEQGQMLLANADAQLSEALWYGWATIVRDRLAWQASLCDHEAEGNWAMLQVVGPVLSEQAQRVDPNAAASLDALWAQDAVPTDEDLGDAIAVIDATFGCG